MKRLTIVALILFIQMHGSASQPRKVLIIGIDGTRSDALQNANTPTIDGILTNSFFTYEAWHHGITISGPSWSSILTGVEYTKHGVKDNSYANSLFNIYPYFTTRAKSCLPDLYCVQITQWAAMSDHVYNDSWNKKIIVDDGAGDQTVAKVQEEINNPDLDVLFAYFDEVDLAGHSSGFSPNNPKYIQAIESVDGHIGKILTALHNRINYANEQWIILLVTDHGGIFTGHGGDTPVERKIWWIGAGNRKGTHQLKNVQDPGSIHVGIYSPAIAAKSPGQCDIALTALDHLLKGSPCGISTEWNLDGKSWLDSIYVESPTDLKEQVMNHFDFICYPNPGTDLMTILLDNPGKKTLSYELSDISGKCLEQKEVNGVATNLQLNFSNRSKGIYFISIHQGYSRVTRKIIVE